MNHHLRLFHTVRYSVPNTVAGGSIKGTKTTEIGHSGGGRLDVDVDLTVWPQHTMTDLIAETDQ